MAKYITAFAFALSFFINTLLLTRFASSALSADSAIVIFAYICSWSVTFGLMLAFVLK